MVSELQKWSPNSEISSNGSLIDNKKTQQPKTVRMVKRDSKDRFKMDGNGGKLCYEQENTSSPPPTLPRGNSQNVHNFLKNDDDSHNDIMEASEKSEKSQLNKASTLPRSFRAEDLKDLKNNGPVYSGLVKPSMIHGTKYSIGYRKKVQFCRG